MLLNWQLNKKGVEIMKVTTNKNYAVWTQPAHKLDGKVFPAMVITGKRQPCGGYKPIKMI